MCYEMEPQMKKAAERDEAARAGQRIAGAHAIRGVVVGIVLVLAACSSKPTEPGPRFPLHGRIVAVNLNDGMAVVDHDAIPGFMDAMTMSYPVRDKRVLATLQQGDEIKADVVVVDNVPHLENVVVIKHASKPAPAAS